MNETTGKSFCVDDSQWVSLVKNGRTVASTEMLLNFAVKGPGATEKGLRINFSNQEMLLFSTA